MRVGRSASDRPSWDRVSVHDSFESGRAALALYDDGTKNQGCHWKREPGGSAQRIMFACSMHLDCGAKVRLVSKPSGSVLERLRNVEHSNEINEYDRANAALTREQKGSFREAKRYGGTATDIMKNHQVDELAKLQKAAGGKRKVCDDAGVEGARPGLEGLHCLHGLPTALLHGRYAQCWLPVGTFDCIRLHATACDYICIHTRAYDRVCIHAHTTACGCMCAHTRVCAIVCACARIRLHSNACDCMQLHATACVCIDKHSIVYAYARIQPHSAASDCMCRWMCWLAMSVMCAVAHHDLSLPLPI